MTLVGRREKEGRKGHLNCHPQSRAESSIRDGIGRAELILSGADDDDDTT